MGRYESAPTCCLFNGGFTKPRNSTLAHAIPHAVTRAHSCDALIPVNTLGTKRLTVQLVVHDNDAVIDCCLRQRQESGMAARLSSAEAAQHWGCVGRDHRDHICVAMLYR